MNFTPFGTHHFSAPIPNIHQFAAKLSQDFTGTTPFSNSVEEISSLTSRYTANGIPSFTQHHHATAPQQLLATSNKCNGTYLNSVQNVYAQTTSKKPQNYDQNHSFESSFPIRHQDDKTDDNAENRKKDHHEPVVKPSMHHPQQHSQGSSWQNLTTSNSPMVDYLSQFPANSLPISLHEFLKYSAETLKKDSVTQLQTIGDPNFNVLPNNGANVNNIPNNLNGHLNISNNPIQLQPPPGPANNKKKKKKKQEKEKKPKPKPGEIRLSTALDGSTLYCCPECHMALPERDLLEQHLMGHNMERRFVCDICGAALKRKDHLTRHKQSHNPERPFVCSVCLKAFKRKEQLTLHFVIHSGEKRHVCTECGKGFYRKDHLRKHTRSHIARRVKAELSQQGIAAHGITS
ncbi:hypothetical protein ABEB36_014109 [Hypothenemus hampei]|uniref:C2H2-type domain-containing protein n=1 Tax=Hypothenemus hampei TaxID=57062 RepID=A0ABD1E3B6_HYPHA